MRPTADDGLTDGLRREGCLVWNTALALMVSLAETPLTGKPDAGNPPVRFGGRGSGNAALPTPIPQTSNVQHRTSNIQLPRPVGEGTDLGARGGRATLQR